MTAIALTDASLRATKRALVSVLPDAKSAHISEALAFAGGFRTQAALLAALGTQNLSDPDIILLDDAAFLRRLLELDSSQNGLIDDPVWFDELDYSGDPGVFRTYSPGADEIDYESPRLKAWRNAMVAGINEAIARRLFTIRAGDNRWPGAEDKRSVRFRFEIEGIPAAASVRDGGFDELHINVALWPTPEWERWISVSNAGFHGGEVFASGWLERQDGAWLQVGEKPLFKCRRSRLQATAALTVASTGYADRGPFRL